MLATLTEKERIKWAQSEETIETLIYWLVTEELASESTPFLTMIWQSFAAQVRRLSRAINGSAA